MDRSHHSNPTCERCNDEAIGEEKALVLIGNLELSTFERELLADGEQLGE